jgi:FSR family fosmidomycin resistance protein-like MFS transporter
MPLNHSSDNQPEPDGSSTSVAGMAANSALWTRLTSGALLLGVVHALVDAACGYLLYNDLRSTGLPLSTIVSWIITYNLLAFAGQAPLGYLADRLESYRGAAIAGALGAAAALALAPTATRAAVVVTGVANALFHVGAGALVLRASGERSTESGVFVGPGAIGLFAGLWLGAHSVPVRWAFVLALLVAIPLLNQLSRGVVQPFEGTLPKMRSGVIVLVMICAACLLGSVTVRSLVGGTIAGPWRGVSTQVLLMLALAACGGKMLGGFVSDRLGWTTISVSALLLSAPLITLWVGYAAGAVLGMLLFQMTMPVTLKAMHHVLPTRPGLAFGIPCFALILGAMPGLLGHGRLLRSWWIVAGLLAVSTLLVFGGLRMLVRVGASGGPARPLRGLGSGDTHTP